jgi:mannosylglucosylglycerate synthase
VASLALVSYRLGGGDGVAIEAAKWIGAFTSLGHQVTTVAGDGDADHLVAGLALDENVGPDPSDLDVVSRADLTIVENVASLPLNPAAREGLYRALAGRRAIFHHHDLSWQRDHLAHLEGPRDEPGWIHVTINELSRRQLSARGIEATTIYNSFECDPPAGNRSATRARLDVATNERLVLLPSRALARKNIPGAIRLCERLDATLWLLGPAEDGYGDELATALASSKARVVHRGLNGFSIHDAYAACDAVVMASTWEGFGNPVLESVTHRRPLALHPYPVAEEIRAFGFRFFDLEDVGGLARFLDAPDDDVLEANLTLAREHFNLADLPTRLERLLATSGIVSPRPAAQQLGSR